MANKDNLKKASYFEELDNNQIRCLLCPHQCKIGEDQGGRCRGRINYNGVLYSENYGQISSMGIDPIEKKPLYHFFLGSDILSLGTYGCNFNCDFCQNWQISQEKPGLKYLEPGEVVDLALEKDAIGIAYTYSEPSVWYEFILETSKLASDNNLKNVLVTNGFINQEPLGKLLPFIDAANVDLKSFTDDFYRHQCGGDLKPVLENIKLMNEHIHLELTTLLIQDLNDSEDELRELFAWIENINSEIPLHISRYFPNYKLNKTATSLERMKWAYSLAGEYLSYIYLGNTNLEIGQDTVCPQCEEKVIKRNYYRVNNLLEDGECPYCGYKVIYRKK